VHAPVFLHTLFNKVPIFCVHSTRKIYHFWALLSKEVIVHVLKGEHCQTYVSFACLCCSGGCKLLAGF